MKRNRKWKISYTFLERRTLCYRSYKNRKLRVKLRWVGARKRKKRIFFVPFILSEGNFFNIYILCQYIVYWIQFQNIHTFKYQRTLLHTLFCLFLKSSKAFIIFLTWITVILKILIVINFREGILLRDTISACFTWIYFTSKKFHENRCRFNFVNLKLTIKSMKSLRNVNNSWLTMLTGKNCVLLNSVQEPMLGCFWPFSYVYTIS